jgi:hypothetical protein
MSKPIGNDETTFQKIQKLIQFLLIDTAKSLQTLKEDCITELVIQGIYVDSLILEKIILYLRGMNEVQQFSTPANISRHMSVLRYYNAIVEKLETKDRFIVQKSTESWILLCIGIGQLFLREPQWLQYLQKSAHKNEPIASLWIAIGQLRHNRENGNYTILLHLQNAIMHNVRGSYFLKALLCQNNYDMYMYYLKQGYYRKCIYCSVVLIYDYVMNRSKIDTARVTQIQKALLPELHKTLQTEKIFRMEFFAALQFQIELKTGILQYQISPTIYRYFLTKGVETCISQNSFGALYSVFFTDEKFLNQFDASIRFDYLKAALKVSNPLQYSQLFSEGLRYFWQEKYEYSRIIFLHLAKKQYPDALYYFAVSVLQQNINNSPQLNKIVLRCFEIYVLTTQNLSLRLRAQDFLCELKPLLKPAS